MTRRQWDDLWCTWYRKFVRRGRSPNAAIPLAYQEMAERYGTRPEETK